MFENLRKLYSHHGGIRAIMKSGYFWLAIFLSALSYKSVFDFVWTEIALGVLPSLTGFTIAAFAIIFAILDPKMLKSLMPLDKNGHSPIASIAAAIGHAVFIQVTAMVLAVSVKVINLNGFVVFVVKRVQNEGCSPNSFLVFVDWVKWATSASGLLFTYYGILLVLAAILSIVRMQLIVADTTKSDPSSPRNPPAE